MKPIRLTIKNGCQYDDYVYEYYIGVTGITGLNGTGKTNLMHVMQQFAITGKTNIDGKSSKTNILQWGATKGHTVFEFSHNGMIYTLTRSLKGSKILLECEDSTGTSEWKQAEADKVMEEILGMSFNVFREVCFVAQGNLWGILTMTHSKRMEYFQRLTDAWQAENIRTLLDKASRRVPVYPNRDADIEAVKANIKTYDEIIHFQAEQIKEQEDLKSKYDECVPDAKDLIANMIDETTYKNQLEGATVTLNNVETQLAQVGSSECPEEVTYPAELMERKNQHLAYTAAADRYSEAHKRLKEIVAEAAQLVELPEPDSQIIHDKQAELTALENKLKAICPTCERPMEGAENIDKDKIDAECDALRKELHKISKVYADTHIMYKENVATRAAVQAKAESAKEAHKEACEAIPDEVEFDPVELVHALDAHNAYTLARAEYDSNQKDITILQQHKAVAEHRLLEAQQTKYITDKKMVDAKLLIDQYGLLCTKLTEMQTKLRVTETEAKGAKDQLKLFEGDNTKRDKADEVRRKLERCRDLLHREKLPKIVMSSMLVGLNHHMNEMLVQFNMGFDAILDEDFNFKVACVGKDDASATDLSGGQKVILAIAFHIGLGRLLGGAIPFMVLDEPTNHVDKHNKPILRDALMRLKGAGAAGTEYMFVTHDDVLQPTFDREIEIIKK